MRQASAQSHCASDPQHVGAYCQRHQQRRGGPLLMLLCHCGQCQKATGGAFMPVLVAKSDSLRLTKGETRAHISRPRAPLATSARAAALRCSSSGKANRNGVASSRARSMISRSLHPRCTCGRRAWCRGRISLCPATRSFLRETRLSPGANDASREKPCRAAQLGQDKGTAVQYCSFAITKRRQNDRHGCA
jgi:hypothetical protein